MHMLQSRSPDTQRNSTDLSKAVVTCSRLQHGHICCLHPVCRPQTFLNARTESLTKTESRSQTGATSTANLLLAFQPQFTHKTAVKTSKNDLHNYSVKLVVDDWVSPFLAKVLPAASATTFFLLSLSFLLHSIPSLPFPCARKWRRRRVLTSHSFGHMTYGSLCSAGRLGSDDIVSCKVAAKGAGEGPCAREGEHDEW